MGCAESTERPVRRGGARKVTLVGADDGTTTATGPVTTASAAAGGRFVGPGPTVDGELFECFKGGLLFRVVDGAAWAFYNDTSEYEMHVVWRFGPESAVEALQGTAVSRDDEGWFVCTTTVYPGETQLFVQGEYNGYKGKFCAKPLSDEYLERVHAAAEATVGGELQAVEAIGHGDVTADATVAACVRQRLPYVDLSFRPGRRALSRPLDERQLHPMAWHRPAAYLTDGETASVLIADPTPFDVMEGQLGDSWFACAMAVAAGRPAVVRRAFATGKSSAVAQERAVGAYRVVLNKGGWWHTLVLDDYLPCVGNAPAFASARGRKRELWPALLQKGYAKASASYSAISAGDSLHALQDITGAPTHRFDALFLEACASGDPGPLFELLHRHHDAGALVLLNTPNSPLAAADFSSSVLAKSTTSAGGTPHGGKRECERRYRAAGLALGRAYAVLRVASFPQHGVSLVQLRNPWDAITDDARTEWGGDWCDGSTRWSEYPDIARACGYRPGVHNNVGTAWMEWKDVAAFFDGGGACLVRPGPQHDYRVAGMFRRGLPDLALEVTVSGDAPVPVTAVLSQPDKRGQPRSSSHAAYAALMLSVCRPGSDGRLVVDRNSTAEPDRPTERFSFLFARDVALEYTFSPSPTPYLVVPRIYDAGASKQFVLGLLSEAPLLGAGVAVRLVRLPEGAPVFRNFLGFEYDPDSAPAVPARCQYRGPGLDSVPEDTTGEWLVPPQAPGPGLRSP